jgi:phage shock protein A
MMFKTVITLIRGASAKAEEDFADRHALLILDQQIRDAAAATEGAKRALSLAIAQDQAEGRRLETTLQRIADLEERATAALAGGRDDLATEAAEAIALMEADRDAIREARKTFAADLAQLRTSVANASHRLAELERGRRIAVATESVRRLKTRSGPAGSAGMAALAEAEGTLQRLRERQVEETAAESAYESLVPGVDAMATASRLEAAGFGQRTRQTAADVLARLRENASNAKASQPNTPNPAPAA